MVVLKDFSEQARDEFLQAISYYSEYSESAANRFYRDFEVALNNIAAFPNSWPLFDAEKGIYRYVMTGHPYVIYYRLDIFRRRTVILSVFNTYRNPRDLKLD
jgi:plasmid stabilization system protein ParE